MCGIFGVVGSEKAAPTILDGLRRLEYRGYDSAGLATLAHGQIVRRRAVGKLVNLERLVQAAPLGGETGIGHTRWATHGVANEANAHPHVSCGVAIVHNGIIENYAALREEAAIAGYVCESDTDTEVIAHLVAMNLVETGDPVTAWYEAIGRLKGSFALAGIFAGYDGLMVVARSRSPLAIGHGTGQTVVGSDAANLAPFAQHITYLEDGDWAVIRRDRVTIFDPNRQPVDRATTMVSVREDDLEKGPYQHFMEKEIYQQPAAIETTLSHYVGAGRAKDGHARAMDFKHLDMLILSACGTAYFSAMVAKYWFERYARLPVYADIASEFRYRHPITPGKSAALFISQSGETADTLASLDYCRRAGMPTASIVNAKGSTMSREASLSFPTDAGPEIAVASTKAFTSQLTVLAWLVIQASLARGTIDGGMADQFLRELCLLPDLIRTSLSVRGQVQELSNDLKCSGQVLFMGRNVFFPLALEGALKLKEVSYIQAEGHAAGELGSKLINSLGILGCA
jgi:glucosamine--fructose-6-phosphate aminotransferase (isomerizing)